MKTAKLLLLLTVVFFSFVSQNEFGLVENPERILKELKQVADKTNSIQAAYTEEKFISVLSNSQITKGNFYYQKEDKMRWEQTIPYEYIILISGETLRIKDNGKEKNISQSNQVAVKINAFMMSLIQGEYQDNKQLTSKCFESKDKYLIELTPTTKALKKVYSKLNLYFSKTDKRLGVIEFFEEGGDKKIVTFSNQEYNKTLDAKLFTTL